MSLFSFCTVIVSFIKRGVVVSITGSARSEVRCCYGVGLFTLLNVCFSCTSSAVVKALCSITLLLFESSLLLQMTCHTEYFHYMYFVVADHILLC